jgi:HAD superfamily hydrolase (TIGR01509 family)
LDWDYYSTHCIGVSDRLMLEVLARKAGRGDADSLWPLYGDKRELFRRRVMEIDVCPAETIALIGSLDAFKLAVVTSSGRTEVEPVLERAGIAGHLDAAVYGNEVKRLKPAPDPYLRAAELLSSTWPLVVEDSEAGVTSARAAGFDVIQVRSPEDVAAAVRQRISLFR